MSKIAIKAAKFILVFVLTFVCVFVVIKTKNHYFYGTQNNKIRTVDLTARKGSVSFPEIPLPDGVKEVYSKGGDPKISGVKVLMYNCPQGLDDIKSFYQEKMAAAGWAADSDAGGVLKRAMGMECLAFKNRDFNCYIELESFKGADGTAMVIQLIRSVNKEL